MVTHEDVRLAAARIAPYVRKTPLVRVQSVRESPLPQGTLVLKLECLQVAGSFKARGVTNKLLSLAPGDVRRGIVTASGGNHGLAAAYAGWLGETSATVFLPESASHEKMRKLEQWGAKVVVHGRYWDEANAAALALAERDGLSYLHPFADPLIIAGQGTTGVEILEAAPDVDAVIVAIGGGGLISGVGVAVKAARPAVRVIGVEPVGAPTLHESVKAGRVVTLPAITTSVATMAAARTEPLNLRMVQEYVDEIVLVTDQAMREAARWLWFEMGIAADLSGAAAVAALRARTLRGLEGRTVCALISGAGPEGLPETTGR
jgi:threonine dehydratase